MVPDALWFRLAGADTNPAEYLCHAAVPRSPHSSSVSRTPRSRMSLSRCAYWVCCLWRLRKAQEMSPAEAAWRFSLAEGATRAMRETST